MRDYLITNQVLVPALQPVLDRFAAAGGDPDLLLPVIGVQREYLESALDDMRERYGTVEGYFTEGLGIDADGQDALRAAFVERP
jgi:protein-tyrosine phosphatase